MWLIGMIAFSLNVLIWMFPDQFFSMKAIALKLKNDEIKQALSLYTGIHREIFPLISMIVLYFAIYALAFIFIILLKIDRTPSLLILIFSFTISVSMVLSD